MALAVAMITPALLPAAGAIPVVDGTASVDDLVTITDPYCEGAWQFFGSLAHKGGRTTKEAIGTVADTAQEPGQAANASAPPVVAALAIISATVAVWEVMMDSVTWEYRCWADVEVSGSCSGGLHRRCTLEGRDGPDESWRVEESCTYLQGGCQVELEERGTLIDAVEGDDLDKLPNDAKGCARKDARVANRHDPIVSEDELPRDPSAAAASAQLEGCYTGQVDKDGYCKWGAIRPNMTPFGGDVPICWSYGGNPGHWDDDVQPRQYEEDDDPDTM